MLKICLVFLESEPQYAYKLYAYKKKTCTSPIAIKISLAFQIIFISFIKVLHSDIIR